MSDTKYDSTSETIAHISRVRELMENIAGEILLRSGNHDRSKLLPPEKPVFDEVTPKLKAMTYGSQEYQDSLKKMKPALDHHYANNRHHPEHFQNGIDGMHLVDLLEMICDWKCAVERHANGSIEKSLKINKSRFQITDQVINLLRNTITALCDSSSQKGASNE